MKVIAFSGWRKSGKDTAAECLIKEFNYTRYAFADTLKHNVAKQYNIQIELFYDQKFKEFPLEQYPVISYDPFSTLIHDMLDKEFAVVKQGQQFQKYWTPRALLILEGSIKRSVNYKYWTQKVISDIRAATKDAKNLFVITDLRFRAELEQLKCAFGNDLVTARINRFDVCSSEDPSEHELDNNTFDFIIDNSKTLQELPEEVNKLHHAITRIKKGL